MDDATDHLISPKFRASKASPGTFVDWVDIYEDRTWGWLLEHADRLRKQGPESCIAALHLAVAFIEPYEVFRSGRSSEGHSKDAFAAGFKRIFNKLQPAAASQFRDLVVDAVYKELRCGLFHVGLPGTLLYLTNSVTGIAVNVDASTQAVVRIMIDPNSFIDAVIGEFREYVTLLRSPAAVGYPEARQSFETAWHLVHARKS